MKETLMDILCCPLDKEALELEVTQKEPNQTETEIIDGELVCTECGTEYPINDGIPNLLPPDMRE
ncbi:methytransferase partner Trm112 [Halocatena salina]|uniref:Methytransferase partner Trm112 n=1 Tax=Halocatena salina TaxID=2934340 RepID=A0A8U0A3U8_9EURY|nr:methytransferase partner Trm112 [Halocatena salina]UPM43860.1 methytransferase partner Trm112 [Halocatena salina]